MKSSSRIFVLRSIVLLALALAGFIAAQAPAWADQVNWVSNGGLQSACAKAGGYFSSSDSGHSYFCVKGGNAVICSDYKHKICASLSRVAAPKSAFGLSVIPTTAEAMATGIPCDPVFCKIFCGGRPICTFGGQTLQVIRPEAVPAGSLSSFSGGTTAPPPHPLPPSP